jgi:predicted TIM-barrel fold metal-dependent hydrolase
MMRTDVHTHYLPSDFFNLMDRVGAAQTLESFSVFGPMLRLAAQRTFAPGIAAFFDDWNEQMQQTEIDLSVLSVGAIQPYFTNRETASSVARQVNTMLAGAVVQGGRRFAAFGSLPLPHVEAALEELKFCLDDCQFVGINLGTSACGLPLDAPQFEPLWAALNERHATVFIHPGTTPRMGVGAAEFHLAPDFCSPTETALALCRLVVGRVTLRFPQVNIIAAALGGALPFFARRFDTGMRRSHPELYEELGGILPHLRSFWYDTSITDEPFATESVRQSLGVDRLIFGSDFPRGPLTESVASVTSSPYLTQREQLLILNGQDAQALGRMALP